MKEIAFLEQLAERLLEGTFARVLKPRLQPVQVAKALTREMDRVRRVGPEGPLAANRYAVYLHPSDLADFADFRASLERELAGYLQGYAIRRGLALLAPVSVRLLPAGPDHAPGKLLVQSSLVDVAAPLEESPSTPPAACEGTLEMPVAAPPRAPARRPAASLVDDAGQSFGLDEEATTIGRAVDNDIVLDAVGISRHHAVINWDGGHYLLLDQGSTNGTFATGERVTRHVLSDGDEISLGAIRFTFRLDQDPG